MKCLDYLIHTALYELQYLVLMYHMKYETAQD